MKVQEFKKMLKEAIREVLREENITTLNAPIKEPVNIFSKPKEISNSSLNAQADSIQEILMETAQNGSWRSVLNMATQDIPTEGASFSTRGQLPGGEIPLETIMKLMNGNRS